MSGLLQNDFRGCDHFIRPRQNILRLCFGDGGANVVIARVAEIFAINQITMEFWSSAPDFANSLPKEAMTAE